VARLQLDRASDWGGKSQLRGYWSPMDDWVLDSLVGFLKSPTWSLAVGGFTDKNCAVFDPGEENKFSYTDIHREYQKLVGLLAYLCTPPAPWCMHKTTLFRLTPRISGGRFAGEVHS
jgi:hypothetical protein